jgi:outer membrane protein assembly factor BamB
MAVAGGRLFTHTARAKKEEVVLCLDPATGKQLWRHAYPCDYNRYATLIEGADHGPRATPAVDGERVYTIGTTGILLCLEARTGKQLWRRELLKIASRSCPPRGYCSSPLVVGKHVYVHPGGSKGNSVAALDKKDGRLVWQALDDPLGHATPVWLEFEGTPQVLFFTGRGAVAVAPRDGRLLWRYPWTTQPDHQVATPIYSAGKVFLSSGQGIGGAVFRLGKGQRPETVWKTNVMQCRYATPVLYKGKLYGFSEGRLRCVDFASGERHWDKAGLGKGTLLLADGMLIVLGERGHLVLAEATPKRYVEKARCKPLDDVCLTAPALADGRLFIRNARLLLALDLRAPRRGAAPGAPPR